MPYNNESENIKINTRRRKHAQGLQIGAAGTELDKE